VYRLAVSNPSTRLTTADANYLVRGFMKLSDRHSSPPLVIESGKGVWVFDEHGTPYIEAVAGMWCAAFGFGEEELIEAAVEQFRKLPYYHTLTNKTVGPAVELAEKLASMTPVPNAKVHLVTSGSEANDFLIKFVRYHNNAIGRPERKTLIARSMAYHGATLGASSLTGIPRMHQAFDLPLPGIVHTHDPHFYRHGLEGESAEAFSARMASELERLIIEQGPETIAGFVAEPVTGGGGVIVPPDGYYDEIQSVLARYDVPFFADEVITGFCRTGNWFGSETFGIRPQSMTLGKGLSSAYQPIAALVLSGDIYDGMEAASDQVGVFAHGATYSGHPVASAVALRSIQLMEERKIVDHVRSVMPVFEQRLRSFTDHRLVGDVRVCGLMGALELVADKPTRRMFDPVGSVAGAVFGAAQRHGLIVRTSPSGDTIAFCPPLVITEEEINELFDRFERALADVEADVGALH
jgi:4-aminobutyrate--pyruvate transaminase